MLMLHVRSAERAKELKEEIFNENYTITVNGNVYNVTVEEGTTAGAAPVYQRSKAAPAPKQHRQHRKQQLRQVQRAA